jgi:glycosyltransferase involved in cell wall biosynthesis
MRVCIVIENLPEQAIYQDEACAGASLALLLSEHGHEVTILLTDDERLLGLKEDRHNYTSNGILLERIQPPEVHKHDLYYYARRSANVLQFLHKNRFDVVCFGSLHADGFIPVQAKRTGIAFDETVLVNLVYRFTSWVQESKKEYPTDVAGDFAVTYCERYALRHADYVVSYTGYMLDWVKQNRWELPEVTSILFPLFRPLPNACSCSRPLTADPSHLIYAGDIDIQHGLELFVDALNIVSQRRPGFLKRISFIGKAGQGAVDRADCAVILDRLRADHPRAVVDWVQEPGGAGLAEYVSRAPGLVIVPPIRECLPYTVIEACAEKVPFLASRVGGIPEVVGNDRMLFDPDPHSLADRIISTDPSEISGDHSRCSSHEVDTAWLELFNGFKTDRSSPEPAPKRTPQVSICIPVYNSATLLEELLASLEKSTWPDFEVICVDDGSENQEEADKFNALSLQYRNRGWKFERIAHGGAPCARNHASSMSEGEYLIFMDSDNLAVPTMIEIMVHAIEKTGLDCLTCHSHSFDSVTRQRSNKPLWRYTPLGPCIPLICWKNVLGDTNFIMKRDVFIKLGGFSKDSPRWQDWELLSRLVASGCTLDVIPDSLFWYRVRKGGITRTTARDEYDGYRRIMRPWRDRHSLLAHDLFFGMHSLRSKPHNVEEQFAHASVVELAGHLARIFKQIAYKIWFRMTRRFKPTT